MTRHGLLAGLLLIALLSMAPEAPAANGFAAEAGRGTGAEMGRIAWQWYRDEPIWQGKQWQIVSYWDAGIGQWHRNSVSGQNEDITEIGLAPVFRFQTGDRSGLYLEGAVGVHFLSETSLGPRQFSTSFQFGDHVGVGLRLGRRGQYDLSFRYQHLSNGGIKKPNDGINFNQIRLQYHF